MNRKRRGFTLAELLIVVAIIAVLVAIAIPIFRKQLEKSREAVDIHTMRTVASLGQQFYYEGVHDEASATAAGMGWYGKGDKKGWNAFAAYDPSTGKFYKSWESYMAAGGKGYGKGTKVDGGTSVKGANGFDIYASKEDYTLAGCQVCIYPNADRPCIEVAWKEVKTGSRNWIGKGDDKGHAKYKYMIYLDE